MINEIIQKWIGQGLFVLILLIIMATAFLPLYIMGENGKTISMLVLAAIVFIAGFTPLILTEFEIIRKSVRKITGFKIYPFSKHKEFNDRPGYIFALGTIGFIYVNTLSLIILIAIHIILKL